MRSLHSLIGISTFAMIACGSTSPAKVAGDYTVATTNRDNGCMLGNWTVGATNANIGVTITQDGSTAMASVNGLVGGILDFALGDHVFAGSVDGDFVNLTLVGTRSQTAGNCTYTYNAVLSGTLTGDVLQGNIKFVSNPNSAPDCTSMGITGCASVMDFNGTRPPT
jgi:hypothetical protein